MFTLQPNTWLCRMFCTTIAPILVYTRWFSLWCDQFQKWVIQRELQTYFQDERQCNPSMTTGMDSQWKTIFGFSGRFYKISIRMFLKITFVNFKMCFIPKHKTLCYKDIHDIFIVTCSEWNSVIKVNFFWKIYTQFSIDFIYHSISWCLKLLFSIVIKCGFIFLFHFPAVKSYYIDI